MKKVALIDKPSSITEPYDRKYMLGMVAGYCYRNPSILRNASLTYVWERGYKNGAWEDNYSWILCVSFEIDELNEAKWEFLEAGIGEYWIDFHVLPDDWKTFIIYPSEFKK
ncbi:MAG: hypothetical protein AAB935_02175 [Patescibacteria group bacterium]